MTSIGRYVAPLLLGAVLLFLLYQWPRTAIDPECGPLQARHSREMHLSDQTLQRLSSLSPTDQCLFYRERASLLSQQVRPGARCFGPGRNGDALKRQTEARLYQRLAETCTS
jgi:hypothetical protein